MSKGALETAGASLPGTARAPTYAAEVAVERVPVDAPEEFLRAVECLRAVRLRPEVTVQEVPAPQRISPFALALSAQVELDGQDLATGRFVLLHDPGGQEAWEGSFRAVTLARAEMESEVGADPMLGEVGWSWLAESLRDAGATYRAAGGTVTRVVSESFGSLSRRPPTVEMEVRASWTPAGRIPPDGITTAADLQPHLRAWGQLLCTIAGLPPLPEGVTSLSHRRT